MAMNQLVTEDLREKWKPIVEADVSSVKTAALSRSDILTRLLENQEDWINKNLAQVVMETAASTNVMGGGTAFNTTGAVATWAPVLIKMVKRTVPNLVSMDFMGVQPLSTPDGLIFAMRSRYYNGSDMKTSDEAFYQTIKSGFSGNGTADAGSVSGLPANTVTSGIPAVDAAFGIGMTTSYAEGLGSTNAWAQMGLTIEKQSVSAKSRGLYADYSHELRQDLMAVHGEDVDSILSDMLVTEIQAEMNREFIRTMNVAGKLGGLGTSTPGVFSLTADTDGRWFQERVKSMMFQLELEANAIALETRRGKGNRILCSSNVASALAMTGLLDFTPALAQNASIQVDPTGNTFAGVLANGMTVFIDPYADIDYLTIGYKGPSELDSGIFFSPYTPLEMYRTVGENNFQPRMAFKTRYGISANPFYAQDAAGNAASGKGLGQGENGYFRKLAVTNLY